MPPAGRAPRALGQWALAVKSGRNPEAPGLFFVEGPKAVADAIAQGAAAVHAFVPSGAGTAVDALRRSLAARGVAVDELPPSLFRRLAHTRTPQDVILLARRPASDPGALVDASASLAVYLDGVQDPGNVGAVVRAALALCATHVVAGPGTADPFSPKAARASAGAVLRVPVLPDPGHALLGSLARAGHHLLAADPRSPVDLSAVPPIPARTVLLLGAEGGGLSDGARRVPHATFRIPMARESESLNVAQAAAVALFFLVRRRAGH